MQKQTVKVMLKKVWIIDTPLISLTQSVPVGWRLCFPRFEGNQPPPPQRRKCCCIIHAAPPPPPQLSDQTQPAPISDYI